MAPASTGSPGNHRRSSGYAGGHRKPNCLWRRDDRKQAQLNCPEGHKRDLPRGTNKAC